MAVIIIFSTVVFYYKGHKVLAVEVIICTKRTENKTTVLSLHSPQAENKRKQEGYEDVPDFTDDLLLCFYEQNFHSHSKLHCQLPTLSSLRSAVYMSLCEWHFARVC